MITQTPVLHTVRFDVPGAIPSKPNFRRSANSNKRWCAIKAYEESVGYAALEVGAAYARKHYGTNPVRVEVVAFNQKCDLDNARKILYDSLEGVCFENDRQVVSDEAAKISDPYGARVRITVKYLDEAEKRRS